MVAEEHAGKRPREVRFLGNVLDKEFSDALQARVMYGLRAFWLETNAPATLGAFAFAMQRNEQWRCPKLRCAAVHPLRRC